MPNYLEDYQAYYRLRMQRYEGNADYSNSYQSEKAIYEAIASCITLEEFKDKLGNLNEKNAVALVLDEYTIRLKHYEEIKEPIRAEGCKRILDNAAGMDNAAALITMINEEEHATILAITADTIQPFPDFGYTERIELWENSDVPEKYRERYRRYATEERKNLCQAYAETEKAIRQFQPGWTFDYNRIGEERHRRLLPYPEDIITQTMYTIKSIRHAG